MSSLVERRSSRTSGGVEAPRLPEIVIGQLAGFAESGQPLVDYPGNPQGRPLPALCTAALDPQAAGRDVALLFAEGDPGRPFVVGLLQQAPADGSTAGVPESDAPAPKVVARVDGEQVVITGSREIVLKCGRASLTLTRAGKVLIRGTYLSSRSSGANRIKGGSVQIN